MAFKEFNGRLDGEQATGFREFTGALDQDVQDGVDYTPLTSPDELLTPVTDTPAQAALRAKTEEYERNTSFGRRILNDLQRGYYNALNILPNLDAVARQREINRIREGKAGRTDPLTGEFIPLMGEDAEAAIALLQGVQRENLAPAAKRAAKASAIPRRPVLEAMEKATTAKEAMDLASTDPFGLMGGAATESLPQMAPALALSVATKNPAIGALAMGGTSFAAELGSGVFEYFSENGVNMRDPKAVDAALNNPELFQKAFDFSLKRAGIIGAADTVAGGLASRNIVPKRLIASPVSREAANIGVAQPITQMASGGGGEAAAQLATYGEVKKPGAVVTEMAGEGPGSIAETAAFGGGRIKEELEPAIAPGRAVGKAIQQDVDATRFTESGIDAEARARLSPDNAQLRYVPFEGELDAPAPGIAAAPADTDEDLMREPEQLAGPEPLATAPEPVAAPEPQPAEPAAVEPTEPEQLAGPAPIPEPTIVDPDLKTLQQRGMRASNSTMARSLMSEGQLIYFVDPDDNITLVRNEDELSRLIEENFGADDVSFYAIERDQVETKPVVPAMPTLSESQKLETPDYFKLYIAIQDAKYSNSVKDEQVRDWLLRNDLINKVRGGFALTAIGEQLFTELSQKGLQTQDVPAIVEKYRKRQNVASPAAAVPAPAPRATSRVSTAAGRSIDVEYALVEADQLQVASGDLQPRDRARSSSDVQIAQIAGSLDPERLGQSAEADRGAPIIGPDNIIESGNGRVMAIRRAYDSVPERAQAYRDYLVQAGYPQAATMKNPVLVRRRVTEMTPEERRQFVIEANQSATMAMSSTETGMADAARLDDATLDLIQGRELTSAANRPFVAAFIARVVPPAEQNMMTDPDGRLSPQGLRRIQAALVAAAYNDSALLMQLSESLDSDIKSIASAFIAVAPDFASLRAMIAAGNVLPEMDIARELVQAAALTASLRQQGIKPEDYFAQGSMFEPVDPMVQELVTSFTKRLDGKRASAQSITDTLAFYVQQAQNYSAETGLFGSEVENPAAIDVLRQARKKADTGGQDGLFDQGVNDVEQPSETGNERGATQSRQQVRGRPAQEKRGSASQERRGGDERDQQRDRQDQAQKDDAQRSGTELNDGDLPAVDGFDLGREADGPGGLDQDGIRDQEPGSGAQRQADPLATSRGTRVGQFVQRVSFTSRESFFLQAFRDAGYDPQAAVNFPIQRQFDILAKLLTDTFGLRFVDKSPRASNRKAVDELLDLYRNLQFMSAALELPLSSIGLNGELGLLSQERKPYFGVYYPQGLRLNAQGAGKVPTKAFSGAFIGLPDRTNSMAHEWGHALDFFIQAKLAKKGGSGGLSGFIREEGTSADPQSLEGAFKNLIMALFFDEAQTAARVMELERKIATTSSEKEREKAQAQLQRIREGNARVDTRSEYYKKVSQLPNTTYYLTPTEMIARSFEVYVTNKVEGIGGSTEALTKGLAAYDFESSQYMMQAYPQEAERAKINLAWDAVIEAIRAEAILGRPAENVANRPGDYDIIDPNALFKIDDYPTTWKREVDAWQSRKAEAARDRNRPKNPKGPLERGKDAMGGFLWSERGALLSMMGRYPRSQALRQVVARLTTDPGNSSLNNAETFEEAVDRNTKIFGRQVGNLVMQYELEKLSPDMMEQLRRELVSQGSGILPPELREAAAKIRNLFNQGWYYGNNAGLKMGYSANAYLPRMYDMAKITDDPDGFVGAATRVYSIMFDEKFQDLENLEVLGAFLATARGLAKRKRWPNLSQQFTPENIDDLNTAIKAFNAYRKAERAAEAMMMDPEAEPSAIEAARNKADGLLQDAIEAAQAIYNDVRFVDSRLKGAEWLQESWVGAAATYSSYSPDAEFTKGRVLPPQTDVIMRDYMETDILALMMDYFPKLTRRAEYERRFGGEKMTDLERQMYSEGMLPDDIRRVKEIMQTLTGARMDQTPSAVAKTLSNVQAYGIMALLGRAVMSSFAEPLTATIQTGRVRDGLSTMAKSLGISSRLSKKEREILGGVIGLIGNPYMDQTMANREGGQFQDDPKLARRMGKYFIFTLQTQWINASTLAMMDTSIGYFKLLANAMVDGKDAKMVDQAKRIFMEMGVQQGDMNQFVQWVADLGDRRPTPDEIRSDMGQVFAGAVYRFTRTAILDPKPSDTAAGSKTAFGRLTFSIMSFAYTFQRQVMARALKRVQEEYRTNGFVSATTLAAMNILPGFALLYAGQLVTTTLREALLNPDKFDEEWKKGFANWLAWVGGLAFSRSGYTGAFDPLYNAVFGLKYQKDLATTLVGATPGYFFQALQRIFNLFVNNSKTNTAEYNAVVGTFDMFVVPAMAAAMTRLPAGPITAPLVAAAYASATSPGAKQAVAETIAGEKPKKGQRSGSTMKPLAP